MDKEQKDIKEIFAEAIEKQTPQERAAYLNEVCGKDAELRSKIEGLLKAHQQAGEFLVVPASDANVTIDGPAQIEGPGTKIGRYELLELIGEGGMGLVYLAEQKEPVKRKVALKIVKLGMDTKQVVARFEAERQALALLDHPNIAHVFDAGTTEAGRPYFVMEYVKGMSITIYCDEYKLNIEQRLRLFEQVCEGIHHAHQKGIIHRDIKPSNILVSVHGDRAVPKIIDFGIAKATARSLTDKTMFTFQGQLLGTPEYMSPEQVDLAIQDIDTRSDIYALGVVLYELLAGVLPFERESLERLGFAEVQRTIREQEPASPSIRLTNLGEQGKTIAASRDTHVVALARRLHRELEWIPLKAMRKDRCRRYRSASEMADDIRNYLNGLPLIAGPETAAYRVKKFVHKHAGSVATVVLVAAAIILGFIVSTTMYFRAEDARKKEVVARANAEQAEQTTKEKAEELRYALYVNSIQLADVKYRERDIPRIRELLASCPNDLRGWEWNRLNYISDQSIMTIKQSGVRLVMFSPNGKHIVAGGFDGNVKVLDANSGAELMTFSGHTDSVSSIDFSQDGKRLVSGSQDKTIKLWDMQSGAELKTLLGHEERIRYAVFSPDGKHVLSSAADETIRIWDTATGDEVMTLWEGRPAGQVTFSPDGKYIASAHGNELKIWDANTGVETMSLPKGNNDGIGYIAYSPDGKNIVSCGGWDSRIAVWDISTGTEVLGINSHQREALHFVAFSPDATKILSVGRDPIIKVWDARTGDELRALVGHSLQAAFSPDGRRIAAGGYGSIKVWSVDLEFERVKLQVCNKRWTNSIAFSPDGKYLAASGSGIAKVWDVVSGIELVTLHGQDSWISTLAFSHNGLRIVSGGAYGKVRIWDISDGREVLSFHAHSDYVNTVTFSPDGSHIVSSGGDSDRTIKIWDALTGANVATLNGYTGEICIAFSPDGKKLLSGCCPEEDILIDDLRIWDMETCSELVRCNHASGVFSAAYSSDGKYFASGGHDGDGTIIVWDANNGNKLITLHGHDRGIYSVGFSPDGKRIISGGKDETMRIWDATTGTELMVRRAQRAVRSAVFSPDGKTIAMTDGNAVTLFESAVPTGGYHQRQIVQRSKKILDTLYEEYGLYSTVIEKLKANVTLDESVRKVALQIANSRLWEDEEQKIRENNE